MANRQQLGVLKQGALPWNEWRKKNPDVKPDLYEAGLAGANLRGANLHKADLSLHKSISQELRAILPGTAVAVQPLLNGTRRLYTMFPDFKQYPYVLPGYRYNGLADLQATLEERVIKPAEEKAKELERK